MTSQPRIRLHLWLENGETMAFGMGRVLLLDLIERHGSLRKAAGELGMSYRAAWCKLRASERALGVRLVETVGAKRSGCRLTRQGELLREAFRRWFEAVENCALLKAENLLPWPVAGYLDEPGSEEVPPPPGPGKRLVPLL